MSSSTWVLTLNINGGNSEKTPNTFSDLLDRFNKSHYQGLLIQEPRYSDEHKGRDYNWEKLAELKKLKCLFFFEVCVYLMESPSNRCCSALRVFASQGLLQRLTCEGLNLRMAVALPKARLD